MALVRGRRQLNLRLPLPEPSERRHRFPVPLPPSTATETSSTSIRSTSSSGSSSICPTDLERLQVLGHGNGGTVYKVRHRKTSAVYALKLVQSPDSDPDPTLRRRAIIRERDILLRAADSPHVVRCHAVYEHHPFAGADAAILMEYMDSGTLDAVLKTNGTFSERDLAGVARQVLSGLSYLHARKIIHRDIKPSNLLVNTRNQIKIADFGVSKMMCRTLDACNSYVGTCAYMSPERFDPEAYGGSYDGYAGDIWSLGLTLMELYLGHFPLLPPGQRPDWATLMCAICFGDAPSVPDGVSDEFRGFVECCLQKDSTKRWSAAQLLNHPFLCKLEEEKLS